MSGGESGSAPERAEDLYAEFLRREVQEGLAFEAFIEEHPRVAEALRALRSLHCRPGEGIAGSPPSGLGGESPPTERDASLGAAIDRYARGDEPAGPRLPGGDAVEHFRIISVLGEGGFGTVYRAEQQSPVRRVVALKVLKPGMDTRAVTARFEAERQALALMSHPSIAHVFEAGSTLSGRPFFAMEYIPGIPITAYCERHDLPVRERLELFLPVCEAVQHAHQKAVIHRDLKPSNILVAVEGGRPLPKIIDFGVAKATSRPLTDKTLFTEMGQMIGTPAYMSPEQAEMSGLDVDTRTDIYSLGVILYELLTGALPFDPEVLRRSGYSEIQRIIREEEPLRPSSRIAKTLGEPLEAGARPGGKDARKLQALRGQLRGDLDWIVMKAMAKDRTRRYPTASELAADIRRHLDDEPVLAGPPGIGYRLRKLLRKHRTAAAVILTVFISSIALAAIFAWRSEASFRGSLAAARSALEARDLAAARAALSVLAESRPERREVKELSARVKSLEIDLRAQESAAILEEARNSWKGYFDKKKEIQDLQRRWREERFGKRSWMPPWEREEEFRLQHRLLRSREELEDLYYKAIAGFERARGTAPEGTGSALEARKAFALVQRDLHGIAEREGAVAFSAGYFKSRGVALDPSLFERLPAAVRLETEPADAEVHCFRFAESERRLIPLPFRIDAGDRAEDGLLGEPRPIIEKVWNAVRCLFRAGDRIDRVGGKDVRTWGDLARAIAGLDLDAAVTVEIEREGKSISVPWAPFPGELYRQLPKDSFFKCGNLISLREQLGFTLEAYPLDLDGRCRIPPADSGKAREFRLPEGSYILLVRKPGCREARLPVLSAGKGLDLRVRLFRKEDVPPGFIHIPAGPFGSGGDIEAFQALPYDEVFLEDFFMARLEVTMREYLEFLNDPLEPLDDGGTARPASEEVLRIAGDRKLERILLVPKQESEDPDAVTLLLERSGGKWTPLEEAKDENLPVHGISQLAAREYAHWLTVRRGGGRWRFRVPTDLEWEKAARGADRRLFVWGNDPVWSYAWTNRGIPSKERNLVAGGLSPADESVYGVRDMTGSLSEHAIGRPEPAYLFESIRGGNYYNVDAIWGRIATRNGLPPWRSAKNTGFRLVAEPLDGRRG